jgi:hypothetical protein
MPAQPKPRAAALHAAFACVIALGACSDGTSAGPVDPAVPPPAAGKTVDAVACEADVRAETVVCRPYGGAAASVAAARTLGGQGINVRLANTNVQYDSVAEVFSTDVTVQNLLVQRMGTADGAAVSGVTVFFHAGPQAAGSSPGEVEVRNPDGEGSFTTGAPQPYFHWPQVLPLNAVSASRRWEFSMPRTVGRFTFVVYVRTELLPVIVFDRSTGGNRDIWRVALDGSDLVRLTTHVADDRNPAAAAGRVVYTTYRHGQPDVYAMPLAGGAETRLTSTTAHETDPAISPDGTRVAYASDASGVAKVWWANADGTGAARATPTTFGFGASPEAAPAWGPRGDRLALVATSGGTADLFEMVDGGAPQALLASTMAEVNPAYSADGRFLAYATDATGAGDVYLLRLGTTDAPIQLTSAPEAELYPTFTEDGRVVYLHLLAGGGGEIRWTDPDVPGSGGVVPLPAGNRPDRPYAIVF